MTSIHARRHVSHVSCTNRVPVSSPVFPDDVSLTCDQFVSVFLVLVRKTLWLLN